MNSELKDLSKSVSPALSAAVCCAVLKPLARRGAYLARLTPHHWGLHFRKRGTKPRAGRLPLAVVIELEKAGLIEFTSGETARLSENGKFWLTRQMTNSASADRCESSKRVKNVATAGGQTKKVFVNLDESPLERLRSRRGLEGRAFITEAEFNAGERLRRDFTKAELMPKITATWSGTGGSARKRRKYGLKTNHEQILSDAAWAARQRVAAALRAVGPEFETILLDTCCFLRGVEASEDRYGWPRRSAKLVLKLALSALARHYGHPAPAPSSGSAVGWLRDGARPTISRSNEDGLHSGAAQ